MFIDSAKISVRAGNGGDGKVSFHTARYVPNGGPDGGDGGRGGSVIFMAAADLSTLQDFRYRRKYEAQDGEKGGASNRFGRKGADLRIRVPVGTLIRDGETGRTLADLTQAGQEAVIARGGRGGRGNVHFANSVRQAPNFARAGEPGEAFELQIELKLLADAGLIGYPNVGKSTLLSVVSAARPQIADYEFTTLQPQLGVVAVDDFSFVLADIPGLIEGAHTGRGLGLAFLKHIERTRLLIHVLDASGQSGRDPLQDFDRINGELAAYDPHLSEKTQVVALNKTDLADPQTLAIWRAALEERGFRVFPICAPAKEGVGELIRHAAGVIRQLPPIVLSDWHQEEISYQFQQEALFKIEKDNMVYRVTGDWIVNLVNSTNFDDTESLQYFQRLIRKRGVIDALEKAGVQEGDLVALHDLEFEFIK
ncbi:MAG TPA: GTPase CgtA [Clostridiales bacterium]|nr:GTPase CgtA [Clostridiales bacterium]